ncbi:Ankyrin repeat-containing protein [Glycine soja]|nr:Ankyrin repeat-containing protein [Glycine soja]
MAMKLWVSLESITLTSVVSRHDIFPTILEYCKKITEMKFSCGYIFDVKHSEAMAKCTPNLKVLSIRVIVATMTALCCVLTSLEHLEIIMSEAPASIPSNAIVVEVLNRENYSNWSALVRNYLIGNGLWYDIIQDKDDEKEVPYIEDNDEDPKNHIEGNDKGSKPRFQGNFIEALKPPFPMPSPQDEEDPEQSYIEGNDENQTSKKKNENDSTKSTSAKESRSRKWEYKNRRALHAIQLSCGKAVGQIKECKTAKEAWKHLKTSFSEDVYAHYDSKQSRFFSELILQTNVRKGFLDDAKESISISPEDIFTKSPEGKTVLHVAVEAGHVEIVKILVEMGKKTLVKMQDKKGYTALALAAKLTDNKEMVECMVEIGGDELLSIAAKEGPVYEIPVLLASARGHKKMTRFLFNNTPWPLLRRNRWQCALVLLSRCIYNEIFVIQKIHEKKMNHYHAMEILNCLCERIPTMVEEELREASAYDAMLQAAKNGITEFIESMKGANPDLLLAMDESKRGIFAHAIVNRQEGVFNLIHDIETKEIFTSCEDALKNNLLHIAAELAPSRYLDRISNAALQMQRELQWFQEVKKVVPRWCHEAKDGNDKTASEVFTDEHKELLKRGQQWAKETAGAFTLVGTLIITMMFAAAFTAPGGNDDKHGTPVFLGESTFTFFIVSDAISLITSSSSVLMFIGILTSRYAEQDFIKWLPMKLLFGLVTLFLSVASMMCTFCAALALMLKGYYRIVIAAMWLALLPILVFVPSLLRLTSEISRSTVRFDKLAAKKKKNRDSGSM